MVAKPALVSAARWLATSSDGYCAKTCPESTRQPAETCERARKGSFALRRRSSTFSHAVQECLEHCSGCARCRYISVSLQFRDCSWFETCPQHHTDVPSFRSGLALVEEASSDDHAAQQAAPALPSIAAVPPHVAE
eukprot:6682139-Prymnesium_polylepis.1